MLNETRARLLLLECTGDDIWPIEHCQKSGIPANWIDELRDCYESGFRSDRTKIYFDGQLVNQFEGLRDVDIACKLGEYFNVDVQGLSQMVFSRSALVTAIREAVEEG